MSKVFCFKTNVFFGNLSYNQRVRLLKSPLKRGSINWVDRLPVIQEMAALILDIKSQFRSTDVLYASVLKQCGQAI